MIVTGSTGWRHRNSCRRWSGWKKLPRKPLKCQIPEEDGWDGKEDPLNPFQLGLLLLPLENAKIMVNMADKGKEGFQKEVSRVINEIGRQKNMKSLSDLSF